jgi:hypothetical protein
VGREKGDTMSKGSSHEPHKAIPSPVLWGEDP